VPDPALVQSGRDFLPYAGKPIRRIRVDNLDVFGSASLSSGLHYEVLALLDLLPNLTSKGAPGFQTHSLNRVRTSHCSVLFIDLFRAVRRLPNKAILL
jgi:hypothetical protein